MPGDDERPRPTRLRDLQRADEPTERPDVPRRRRRLPYVAITSVFGVIVVLLAYGLVERNLLRPRVDPTVGVTDSLVHEGEQIQVNVINACGVDGMAARITEFLRARRFDVPEYGNAPSLEPTSKVIDRVGDLESAYKVAYALGIDRRNVETDIDSSLYLRATVVIGEDYLRLRPLH